MPQQPPPDPTGHQPLLEPAVLVTENCDDCNGTGRFAAGPCDKCDASGRLVSEVPMSVAFRMMSDQAQRAIAPPPSQLRAGGTQ